jgi:predicted extracellular nuclease
MRKIALILLLCVPVAATAQVRISQIYGGGGNSGSVWTHDFIELVNAGSVAVDLSSWSLRYASGAGTTWQMTPLAGTIQPMHYYLVQEAAGGAGTTPLPTPDVVGTIAMSASAGKVLLMSTQAAVSGSCPSGSDVVDLVGFGTAATCFEGDSAAPPGGAKTALLRKGGGMVDANNNGADFDAAAPMPRTSASAPLAVRTSETVLPQSREVRVECYPSPFNSTAHVRVTLLHAGLYSLVVMNVLGEEVQVLAYGHHHAGTFEFIVRAGSMPSGIYFCVLQGEGIRVGGRLMLLR